MIPTRLRLVFVGWVGIVGDVVFPMSDPQWYKDLDSRDRDRVDQSGHALLGFLAAIVFARLWIWHREWVRQWPPGKPFDAPDPTRGQRKSRVTQLDRVADTKRDLLFFNIGYTVGQIAQVGLVWRFA
jgi:hypothetical protein